MPLDKSRPTRYNNTSLYITQCYYTRMVLMPAVRKVSKEQIIDAAVEVLRDDGFSAINARSVAKNWAAPRSRSTFHSRTWTN